MVAINYNSEVLTTSANSMLEAFVKYIRVHDEVMRPIIEIQEKAAKIVSEALEPLKEMLREFSQYISRIIDSAIQEQTDSISFALSRVIETPCINQVKVNIPATGPPLIVKANLYIIMLVTWFDTMAMLYLKKAFIAKLISKVLDAFLKYIGMS